MAINGIISNSTRLLKEGIGFGALLSSLSYLYGFMLIVQKLIYEGTIIPVWTAIMVAVFLTTGIILLFLGIIGIYLETIIWEMKNRPYYFIEQRIGKNS